MLISMSTQSALVELTPWECENDSPEDSVEGQLTQCPTSLVPLGWTGWHTTATSHGGPQISTEESWVWNEGQA